MSSFEDVDHHVSKLGALPPINAANPAVQLCVYYKAAKPILALAVNIPFIPAKWKVVLTGFMGLLDTMCP